LERIGQVLGLLADSPWPVDVIAYTPADLRACRHSPFLRRAFEEGKILYERRAA
jgi:hypothetical protein